MTVLVMHSRLLPFCLLTTAAKQAGICKGLAADNVDILLQHEAAQVHIAVGKGATHGSSCELPALQGFGVLVCDGDNHVLTGPLNDSYHFTHWHQLLPLIICHLSKF